MHYWGGDLNSCLEILGLLHNLALPPQFSPCLGLDVLVVFRLSFCQLWFEGLFVKRGPVFLVLSY